MAPGRYAAYDQRIRARLTVIAPAFLPLLTSLHELAIDASTFVFIILN